jgi:redox-sensitive bicupin YhaK (pirin superfamily)
MITLRKNHERGFTKLKWLNSYHTFSFGEYYNPKHNGFSDLKVINDDIVSAGKGFDSHGHKDMEIITVVLSGQLEHQDNIGNKFILKYGDVQRMSAGKGVIHSEFNPSTTVPVHLLQIWVLPNKFNLPPSYEQKFFSIADKQGKICTVLSPIQNSKTLTIHQDVELFLSIITANQNIQYETNASNSYWLHVATGNIDLNGQVLHAGDSAGIVDEKNIILTGIEENSEILLFKLRK